MRGGRIRNRYSRCLKESMAQLKVSKEVVGVRFDLWWGYGCCWLPVAWPNWVSVSRSVVSEQEGALCVALRYPLWWHWALVL